MNRLGKALVFGVVLAAMGIGVFFLLYYVVLGEADNATRLFASMLAPPVVMAVILLGYYVLRRES